VTLFSINPDAATRKDVANMAAELMENWAELAAAKAEVERLEKLVYVPGVLKCAKCSCVLVTTNLHVNTGQVSANNDPQQCPNGCGPMWRRTEREAGNELIDRMDKMADDLNPASGR